MLHALIGTLSLAAAGMLWLAPVAFGAAPANDDFAEREMLGGSLPIEVSRSNVEATKESEESLWPLFSAGHSVWFEWEAVSDGWVTVGGCEADFTDVLGVYTGTAVNALTSVASGNASEGPSCPFGQREYTFRATSGTKYVIAVDGNPMSFPWSPPAETEGTFELRIEATPPPANDNFANATNLVTQFKEEFEGEAFYFGSEFGYNWNATEESGEPDHVGGPHGASVWYSWTPPVSGEAKIGAGIFSDMRLGIYTGDSLETLQLRFGGIGPSGWVTFTADAGTTYRIVVYGLLDGSSGEAETSSFQFNILMRAPVPANPGGGEQTMLPPPLDAMPPQTSIDGITLRPAKRRATFAFQSSEFGSTFRCRLDGRAFVSCGSPMAYRGLKAGKHAFRVAAVDAAGNVDPTPAVARFSIPERKHRKR